MGAVACAQWAQRPAGAVPQGCPAHIYIIKTQYDKKLVSTPGGQGCVRVRGQRSLVIWRKVDCLLSIPKIPAAGNGAGTGPASQSWELSNTLSRFPFCLHRRHAQLCQTELHALRLKPSMPQFPHL